MRVGPTQGMSFGAFPEGFSPSVPLGDALTPPSRVDYEKAKATLLAGDTIEIPERGKHAQEHAQVKGVAQQIMGFAKEHPYLTGMYALGVVVLLCAFPAISDTLVHHAGITIGHAHFAVGIGIGIVCLSYGVTLMHMAKRGALKSLYEAKIEEQNVVLKELLQKPNTDAFKQQAEKTISDMRSYYAEKEARTRQERERMEARIQGLQGNLETLEEAKKEFIERMEAPLADAMKSLDTTLAGAENALDDFSGPLPDYIEIPEKPAEETASIARRLFDKASHLTREHPVATMIGFGGLAVIALSGVMIYSLAIGSTAMPMVGAVSDVAIVQMLAYGVCFLYEAHNRADMTRQKKALKTLEVERENALAFAETIKKQKKVIAEHFDQALNTYETTLRNTVALEEARTQDLLRQCASGFVTLLKGLGTPPIDFAGVHDVLRNPTRSL